MARFWLYKELPLAHAVAAVHAHAVLFVHYEVFNLRA